MFWNNADIQEIVSELDYDGHSGSSLAICLKNMQFIAILGWDIYVETIQGI